MALDLYQNFVSAQYLENKWIEFHQILYMQIMHLYWQNRGWDCYLSLALDCFLQHEKRCSGAIVRFSDNSSFAFPSEDFFKISAKSANPDEMSHFVYIWASSRENLSSGCPTKRVSNQSAELQRLARKLKFCL